MKLLGILLPENPVEERLAEALLAATPAEGSTLVLLQTPWLEASAKPSRLETVEVMDKTGWLEAAAAALRASLSVGGFDAVLTVGEPGVRRLALEMVAPVVALTEVGLAPLAQGWVADPWGAGRASEGGAVPSEPLLQRPEWAEALRQAAERATQIYGCRHETAPQRRVLLRVAGELCGPHGAALLELYARWRGADETLTVLLGAEESDLSAEMVAALVRLAPSVVREAMISEQERLALYLGADAVVDAGEARGNLAELLGRNRLLYDFAGAEGPRGYAAWRRNMERQDTWRMTQRRRAAALLQGLHSAEEATSEGLWAAICEAVVVARAAAPNAGVVVLPPDQAEAHRQGGH